MKRCTSCGAVKPLTAFPTKRSIAAGVAAKCKECVKVYAAQWYEKNAVKVKASSIRYYQANSEKKSNSVAAWQARNVERRARASVAWIAANQPRRRAAREGHRQRYPEVSAARDEVRKALWRGDLQREPCWVCGARAEAHHAAYDEPLMVTWLCKKHHVEVHVMARRLNGKIPPCR